MGHLRSWNLIFVLFFVQCALVARSSPLVDSNESADENSASIEDVQLVVVKRQAATSNETTTTTTEEMTTATTTEEMTTNNQTTTTPEMLWTNEPYANNVVVIAVLCSFAGIGILATAGCLVFHGCRKSPPEEQLLASESKSDSAHGHVNEPASSVAGSSSNVGEFKNPVTHQSDPNRRFSKEESFEMNRISTRTSRPAESKA